MPGGGSKCLQVVWGRCIWSTDKGGENAKADALSRNPVSSESREPVELDLQVAQIRFQDMELPELLMALPAHGVENEFHLEQRKDPELQRMCDFLEAGTLPSCKQDAKETTAQAQSFTLIDKVLYFVDLKGDGRKRAAVPAHLREDSYREPRRIHGWSLLRELIVSHSESTMVVEGHTLSVCQNCGECAIVRGTGRRHRPPLHPIPVQRPFQIVGVDVMELPLTRHGNRYVVMFQDFLIKWPLVFPVPDQKAIRIAWLLTKEVLPFFGVLDSLLSDRGTNLLAHVMQDVCQLLGTDKLNTTAYHPQCNGMVEGHAEKARSHKGETLLPAIWDRPEVSQ